MSSRKRNLVESDDDGDNSSEDSDFGEVFLLIFLTFIYFIYKDIPQYTICQNPHKI